MGGTRFMVQWEEHPSHLATRLGQLLEHQTLVDVTLMCNTHTLRVHRAVLAACSPYFESILQRQLGAHPLIVLKDMQFSVLKSLIEFMYCGETSVTEENLGPLLQAAKFFQVKGLSSMTKEALGLPASPAKPNTINGEATKKGTKRIGMQTTLVSTADVLNKQINSTTIASSAQRGGQTSDAGSTKPISSTSSITTDTAQLLLNLSGSEATNQQRQAVTTQNPSRQLLQMSSRNVRLSNLRGSNLVKPVTERRTQEVIPDTPDTPRRRGRPLKKQINVTFQEKVMTDAEIALQKEADASRLALEALKKEMNTGTTNTTTNELQQHQISASDVVYQVADNVTTDEMSESCEAVEANDVNLVGQDVSQQSEQVVNQTATEQTPNQVVSQGSVSSYMEALKEAGLPTDLPILLDSGDGSYVTVNEEVLMNICNGGVLHYQVAEGNLVQGSDGQVVVHEQAANASGATGATPVTVATPILPAPEVKPVGRRNNRVVTPAGGCGFTTARQIVKASMDKYRQEQAGLRKFVVKEMEAAELILEPSDEVQTVKEEPQQELVAVNSEQEVNQEEGVEWQEAVAQPEGEGQEQGTLTATVGAGQVQALLHTFEGEGGEVYLVTENEGEAYTGESHGFAVIADGTTHGFHLEDGTIVVQEGHAPGTELSVEQALEAMMGSGSGSGVAESDGMHDGEERPVEAQSSAEELQLVLSPAQESSDTPVVTNVRTQVVAEGDAAAASPSKDIPYAVGLLPLKTALEKIQNIQDYQPRKTRSASVTGQPGETPGKRKALTGVVSAEKKPRTDGGSDSEAQEEKEAQP